MAVNFSQVGHVAGLSSEKRTKLSGVDSEGRIFALLIITKRREHEAYHCKHDYSSGFDGRGGVMAIDMPPLAKKHNCNACHSVEKRVVGPAWRDVSKAYNNVGATGSAVDPAAYKVSNKVPDILSKNNARTSEEWLLHKISNGGSGNWGTMPMPPTTRAAPRPLT